MKKLNNACQKPDAEYSCQVKNEILANRGIFKLDLPVVFSENTLYLKDFQCWHCANSLTEQDISQNNYCLWVVNEISEITKTENIHGLGDDKPAYEMNFRLKRAEHRICPLKESSD